MVAMSQKEFQRVKVIENAAAGRLSVREASRLLQLSERQVQRLKRRYRPDSVGWVQHGNRGRSMPWTGSLPQKQLILSLAHGKYLGFQRFSSDGKTSPRGEPLQPARLAELIPRKVFLRVYDSRRNGRRWQRPAVGHTIRDQSPASRKPGLPHTGYSLHSCF